MDVAVPTSGKTAKEAAILLIQAAAVLHDQGRPASALVFYKRALALLPDDPLCWNAIGSCLWRTGKYIEAERCVRRALKLEPKAQGAWHNLGNILCSLRRWREADDCFAKAVELDPKYYGAAWDRAVSQLTVGDWERGLVGWDMRLFYRGEQHFPKMPMPMWNGEDLAGKTLYVQGEQGMGDRIMGYRYLHWVKQQWPTCKIVFLPAGDNCPSMRALMWNGRHEVEFLPAGVPWPDADYGIFLLSIMRIHGSRPGNVPPDPGWIRDKAILDAETCEIPQPHVQPSVKVGMIWAGSPRHLRDRERSIPLELMLQLGELPHVQLYSLQFDNQDIKRLGVEQLICDLTPGIGIRGLPGTAAVMLKLDLIVTVDTLSAHIAGAIGMPTWIMLPHAPDWRWGLKGDKSYWYPSVRLFRQDGDCEWGKVVRRVKEGLASMTASYHTMES